MTRKYQAYPEYRESGVEVIGAVPQNWVVGRLKQIVDQNRQITYGIVQAGPNTKGGIPYIRPADMTKESGVKSYDDLLRTSPEIARDFERSKIKPGDIVCSIGPSFGKLMITPERLDGANLTQGTARVAISSSHNARYFFWALRATSSFQQWESSVGGATFRALNLGPLADTFVLVPTDDEQEKIANFLDHETSKIDTLIEKQQQLIKLLKEKRQAVISHAVTKGLNFDAPMRDSGVEWLGEVPKHWNVSRFKYLISNSAAGPYGSSLTTSMYTSSGIRVYGQQQVIPDDLSIGDYYISKRKFEEMRRYEVFPNELLISVMGTVGRVTVVPKGVERGIINPRLVKYKVMEDKILPHFAKASILSDVSQSQLLFAAQGSTMDGLNMQIIGELPVPYPQSLDEQLNILNEIQRKSHKFDKLLKKSFVAVELLNERRIALISAAITGKIDVRSWQIPKSSSQGAINDG
jgi:type I restriction enzyme S subunit